MKNLTIYNNQNYISEENISTTYLTSNQNIITTSPILASTFISFPNMATISTSSQSLLFPKILTTTYFSPNKLITLISSDSLLLINNTNKINLLSNLTDILKDKKPGQIYKIEEEELTIIIKPTNSTKEPNSTYIDISECESVLRNYYNISNSSFITLLQLELYNNNSNSLINQIEIML